MVLTEEEKRENKNKYNRKYHQMNKEKINHVLGSIEFVATSGIRIIHPKYKVVSVLPAVTSFWYANDVADDGKSSCRIKMGTAVNADFICDRATAELIDNFIVRGSVDSTLIDGIKFIEDSE